MFHSCCCNPMLPFLIGMPCLSVVNSVVNMLQMTSRCVVATPLWPSVRMKLTLLKLGTWSPSGFPKTQNRGQNTSHWGVFDIIENFLKCRCPKWPRMSHLDICSPSYWQKKGRESNWQFDSRPLKVENRPNLDVRWGSATWRWKALEENYKIGSDPVPIEGWGEKL
jgi:hypothetical protein